MHVNTYSCLVRIRKRACKTVAIIVACVSLYPVYVGSQEVATPALPALDAIKNSPLSPSLRQFVPLETSIEVLSPTATDNVAVFGQPPGADTSPVPEPSELEQTLDDLPETALPTDGELIPIRIVLERDQDPTEVIKALRRLRMQSILQRGNLVSGRIPVSAIPELELITGITDIRPAYADVRSGVTFTQGDIAADADLARSVSSLDGSGVTIGILSDSYDCLGQASGDMTNGDLPLAINILDDSFCGSDEGRAMLQIAHDMAPGADLAFHTAFLGELDFAIGIDELVQAGADIIVDDVFYYEEPFFQDGIIAQAASDAVLNNGVSYFTSAGNSGRSSWEGSYNSSGESVISTGDAHYFSPNDYTQTITVGAFGRLVLVLQWDDPYTSLDSNSPGPDTDLDIALLNAGGSVVALSADSNIGSDPYEVLIFNNGPSTQQLDIVIEKQAGPDPSLMKWVGFRGIASIDEYDTASGTVVGHANADSVLSIGAVNYGDTPRYGTSPPQVASYSSGGPATILFLPDGTGTGPLVRDNPDMTAPDAGNNTIIGVDSDNDGFPNFFGTSAAVVHAASAAALLLDHSSNMTPGDIENALESTAISHGSAGYNTDTGHGLVDADAAISTVLVPPTISAPADGATLDGSNVDVFWNGNDVTPESWQVSIGTTAPVSGVGSSDIFVSGQLGASDDVVTATNLPADGSTLYVTLEWSFAGEPYSTTVEVTAAQPIPPSLLTPNPESFNQITGSNILVTWTSGTTSVDEWQLQVGGIGPQSADYFSSGALSGSETSVTVTGLPLNGQTLYFTLQYEINGTFEMLEYTFTADTLNDSISLARDQWHLISIPARSSLTFSDFISEYLDPADFNDPTSLTPWVAFRYDSELNDPVTGSPGNYVLFNLTDSLESLMEGFWLYHLYPASIELGLPSDAIHASGVDTTECATGFFCESIQLAVGQGSVGWTIGAIPSPIEPDVEDLRIDTLNTGTVCDSGCSLEEANQFGISAPQVWIYDPSASSGNGGYQALSAGSTIPRWSGFWVPAAAAAAQGNAELEVPVRD